MFYMDVYISFKIKILVNAYVVYRQEDFINASRCQSATGFRVSHLAFVQLNLTSGGPFPHAVQGWVYCSATTVHQKGMPTG